MTTFNVASLFVFFGIFSTIAGAVGLVVFRRLDLSARYWAIATLASGLTALTTVFREVLPPVLGYSIPVGINVATYLLMGHGISVLDQSSPKRGDFIDRLIYFTIGFTVALELTRRYAGPQAALALTSIGFGAAAIWSSAKAQDHHARTGCVYTLWMRWTLYALGVAQLIRIQGAFTGIASSAFAQDAVNLAIYSMIFILGMLRYIFYGAIRLQEKVDLAEQAVLEAQTANRELQTQTNFISSAMEEAPVACLIADTHDHVLIGNKEAEKLLGRTFPVLRRPARLPLKVEHLFIGMGPLHEWTPGKTQLLFSRGGHGGDARCIGIRGQLFPGSRETPQQVFILGEESVSTEQAGAMVKTQALEHGCSLLLANLEGEILASSGTWLALLEDRRFSLDPAKSPSLWTLLENLQAPPSSSSVRRRDSSSKALPLARKRLTVDGRSSSAFLRLHDGKHCDVLFDLITLADRTEKAVLVELRIRAGAMQPTVQPPNELLANTLPQSLTVRAAES